MSRCTLRNIFTVLVYAGVGVFLFPYLTGHFSNAVIFLVAGIGLALVCGILRCYYTEGDCTDPEYVAPRSATESKPAQPTVPPPHAPSHP
jgi:hypothetical protein